VKRQEDYLYSSARLRNEALNICPPWNENPRLKPETGRECASLARLCILGRFGEIVKRVTSSDNSQFRTR
jgi:hypothetical protein